eukprot:snap_masked-scaffold_37-processed-gene-1.22-mRNA-1 protein AED:1.00 eAED:1.00 QI:0/-1/0/0/-1/1/1/0/86
MLSILHPFVLFLEQFLTACGIYLITDKTILVTDKKFKKVVHVANIAKVTVRKKKMKTKILQKRETFSLGNPDKKVMHPIKQLAKRA